MAIWVFGNTDYFGFHKDLNPQRVQGHIVSETELEVSSKPLQFHKNWFLGYGYGLEVWQRSTETVTSRILIFSLLCYLAYLIAFNTFKPVKRYLNSKFSERGIHLFKPRSSHAKASFESLVPNNEIIYESTLACIMKGRLASSPKVSDMHKDRLSRLNSCLVNRENRAGFNRQRSQKFITLPSYDYRVSPKNLLLTNFLLIVDFGWNLREIEENGARESLQDSGPLKDHLRWSIFDSSN